MADYKYLIFDGTYFLTRNHKLLTSRHRIDKEVKTKEGGILLDEVGNPVTIDCTSVTLEWLATSFYQSIGKFTREIASAEKVILLFDKGPYYKNDILNGDYKGSRVYITQEDVDSINQDDDPIGYAQIKEEFDCEQLRRKSKEFIINNLQGLGFVCVEHRGYEADDLAILISDLLRDDTRKSAIVSIDTDWEWWINQNVDLIKPDGTVISHSDMINIMKGDDVDDKTSLLQYKSMYDSAYGSHNDLCSCVDTEKRFSNAELLNKLLNDDYSLLSNVDLYKLQMKSFLVNEYPEINLVLSKLKESLEYGKIYSEDEFEELKSKFRLRISNNYYNEFLSNLNKELYV